MGDISPSLKQCYFFFINSKNYLYLTYPVEPGLFYIHLCHSLIHSLINQVILSFRIFKTLSIPNRKIWGAETLGECSPPTVYHMSCVTFFFIKKNIYIYFFLHVVELDGGGSVINYFFFFFFFNSFSICQHFQIHRL